jgi:hypothetical protein
MYLIDRLKEPSTWRGIIFLLAALGLKTNPELADSIATVGVAAAGAIEVFRKEKP